MWHHLTKWHPYWSVQESTVFMLRVKQVNGSLGKKYALFARCVNILFFELLFITNDSCFIYTVNQCGNLNLWIMRSLRYLLKVYASITSLNSIKDLIHVRNYFFLDTINFILWKDDGILHCICTDSVRKKLDNGIFVAKKIMKHHPICSIKIH